MQHPVHQQSARLQKLEDDDVTLVQKKGEIQSCRQTAVPICATPTLYNLFSKLLYNRLYKQLDRHQTPDQEEFRRGYWESGQQSWAFRRVLHSIEHKSIWEAQQCQKSWRAIHQALTKITRRTGRSSQNRHKKAASSNYCAAPNKETPLSSLFVPTRTCTRHMQMETRSETLKTRSSQTSDLQVTFRVFLQHSQK